MSELARRIRRARIRRRLTQQQAADRAGVSLTTWQTLERHSADPDSFQDLTLTAAADSLNIPLETVYDWADRPWDGGPEIPGPPPPSLQPPDAERSPAEQIAALSETLHQLAEISETDFSIVCTQARELANHLLMKNGGSATIDSD